MDGSARARPSSCGCTAGSALHAESVVLPLLAPDAPVVTWFHDAMPDKIAYDPLGVFADRRVTESLRGNDPMAALHQRAVDYAPGDTDLSWARTTSWRALIAAAFDSLPGTPKSAVVTGAEAPPTALLVGWLRSKLGIPVELKSPAATSRKCQDHELSDGGTGDAKLSSGAVTSARPSSTGPTRPSASCRSPPRPRRSARRGRAPARRRRGVRRSAVRLDRGQEPRPPLPETRAHLARPDDGRQEPETRPSRSRPSPKPHRRRRRPRAKAARKAAATSSERPRRGHHPPRRRLAGQGGGGPASSRGSSMPRRPRAAPAWC